VPLAGGGQALAFGEHLHAPATDVPSVATLTEEAIEGAVRVFGTEGDVVIEEARYAVHVGAVPGMGVTAPHPEREDELTRRRPVWVLLRELLDAVILDQANQR